MHSLRQHFFRQYEQLIDLNSACKVLVAIEDLLVVLRHLNKASEELSLVPTVGLIAPIFTNIFNNCLKTDEKATELTSNMELKSQASIARGKRPCNIESSCMVERASTRIPSIGHACTLSLYHSHICSMRESIFKRQLDLK